MYITYNLHIMLWCDVVLNLNEFTCYAIMFLQTRSYTLQTTFSLVKLYANDFGTHNNLVSEKLLVLLASSLWYA